MKKFQSDAFLSTQNYISYFLILSTDLSFDKFTSQYIISYRTLIYRKLTSTQIEILLKGKHFPQYLITRHLKKQPETTVHFRLLQATKIFSQDFFIIIKYPKKILRCEIFIQTILEKIEISQLIFIMLVLPLTIVRNLCSF